MTQTSGDKRQSVFSRWIRTGRLPAVRTSDGIELKFNPWHDPADGRFTFAGSGRHHGPGGAIPFQRASETHFRKTRVAAGPKIETLRTGQQAGPGKASVGSVRAGFRPKPDMLLPGSSPSRAAQFVGGVGEGLAGVAKGASATARSVLTTNPVTTVRNVGSEIGRAIDAAVSAEDTPARIQISRAAGAIASASALDIGRATGSVIGNTALAVAPGAALGKVAALRRFRGAAPGTTYDPPQIGWVKENLGRETPAKLYNDSVTGARPGQAPTLMRAMPDGSKRPVKFDGIQGEYLIDRKLKVVDAPRGRAQLQRQSDVLAQHRLIATWEVPNEKQKIKALKMLKSMNITNIKIRVVKP